jgi:microcystin degradation protein MlrC
VSAKRVGILGFLHESNTFLNAPTSWEDFASTSMTEGSELLARWRDAHHELGGMIQGCERRGIEVVPGFATYAVPSGTVEASAFERISAALLSSIDPEVDGVLVALHGATVSEEYPDADGEILRRLRDRFGSTIPIVVTLDLHANVSARMVEHATAIIAYRSNPHLDQRERGLEAASLMCRVLDEGIQPVMVLEAPPLVIPIAAQNTSMQPAKNLYDDLQEVLTWPGILTASVCLGFYYADVAEMGTSFLAVADNDSAVARKAAKYMAQRAWQRREEFLPALPGPEAAVRDAILNPNKPVVLMDVGDNTGGGSSAASTILFEECLRQGAHNALVVLHNPEAVQVCVRTGVRSELDTSFGKACVRTLSDGLFTETQVRHGGWTHCDQGITAVVETLQHQHTIIYTSRRMAPMSLEQLLSLGIHPERKDILIVKGVIAPQAAYAPIAGSIVLVDTPGPTANDPSAFEYQHRRRPLFPIERDFLDD